MNKTESCGSRGGPGQSMLLAPPELDEFKAEGALAIPGLGHGTK